MRNKHLLSLIIFVFFLKNGFAQHEFISKWTTTDGEINIPIENFYSYNYNISWQSINTATFFGNATNQNSDYTVTGIPSGDTIIVKIDGIFPCFFMLGSTPSNRLKIIDVTQWGTSVWQLFHGAFYQCKNLNVTALDAPNLSQTTDVGAMFRGATSFNQDISHWNVSKVLFFDGMFAEATLFNQDLSSWQLDSAKSLHNIFFRAGLKFCTFDSILSSWTRQNLRPNIIFSLDANNQPRHSVDTDSLLIYLRVNKQMRIYSNSINPNSVKLSTYKTDYCVNEPRSLQIIASVSSHNCIWNFTSSNLNAINVVLDSTTTYIVTTPDLIGCYYDTLTVYLHPLPNIQIVTSNPTPCVGDSVLLKGLGAVSYEWKNGSNTFSTNDSASIFYSGNYRLWGIDSNNCSNYVDTTIMFEQPNLAFYILTSNNNASYFCANDTVFLSIYDYNNMISSSYEWEDGNTSPNRQFIFTTDTVITLTSITPFGCRTSTTRAVYVSPPATTRIEVTDSVVCYGTNVHYMGYGANYYEWSDGFNGQQNTVNMRYSSTLIVKGTTYNGCISYDTMSIQVNPLPNVQIYTPSFSVCKDESITLQAMGAQDYVWDDMSLAPLRNVTIAFSNSFTLNGTDTNGCSASTTIEIAANPVPQIDITPSSFSICRGKNVTLDASGANFYTWDNNTTSSTATYTINSDTVVYVIGSNIFDCLDTAGIFITVEEGCINSLQDYEGVVSIFPNPTSDKISVQLSDYFGSIYYELVNAQGLTIVNGIAEQNNFEVTLNYLPNGVYFIRLKINNYFSTYKIIKQ